MMEQPRAERRAKTEAVHGPAPARPTTTWAARSSPAGGTGTYDLNTWVTELQAGSYVLMDTAYGALGLPFRQALFVEATVISVSPPGLGRRRLRPEGPRHGPRQSQHRRGPACGSAPTSTSPSPRPAAARRAPASGSRPPTSTRRSPTTNGCICWPVTASTSPRRGRSICGAGDAAGRQGQSSVASLAARARKARPRWDSRRLASGPSSAKVSPAALDRFEQRVVAEAGRPAGGRVAIAPSDTPSADELAAVGPAHHRHRPEQRSPVAPADQACRAAWPRFPCRWRAPRRSGR